MAVSTKVPLTDKKEVKDLLSAARATRTYCMLTAKAPSKSETLINALQPFDSNDKINVNQLTELRIAMRDVCQEIDSYTLTQILEGNSPVTLHGSSHVQKPLVDEPMLSKLAGVFAWFKRIWPALWQRGVLPGIAVLLLLSAMHFTQRSFQANLLLNRLDQHLATDIYADVRDLIVVSSAIKSSKDTDDDYNSITPAQRVFNQSMNKLKAYHFREKTLRDATATEVSLFYPRIAISAGMEVFSFNIFGSEAEGQGEGEGEGEGESDSSESQSLKPEEKPENTAEQGADLIGTNSADAKENERNNETTKEMMQDNKQSLDKGKNADILKPESDQREVISVALQRGDENPLSDSVIAVNTAQVELKKFLAVVELIAKATNRDPTIDADHVTVMLNLQENAENLKALITYANRFFLPMIYGALGAALFCLIRILTPSLSDLGPGRAFLRILFGAFAAMTLSMLFIPANIFTINEQSNPTLIFLACFLFGYSFGAVMTSLHRMEEFLEGRLKTGEKPQGG